MRWFAWARTQIRGLKQKKSHLCNKRSDDIRLALDTNLGGWGWMGSGYPQQHREAALWYRQAKMRREEINVWSLSLIFYAIINPHQGAIRAVGSSTQKNHFLAHLSRLDLAEWDQIANFAGGSLRSKTRRGRDSAQRRISHWDSQKWRSSLHLPSRWCGFYEPWKMIPTLLLTMIN